MSREPIADLLSDLATDDELEIRRLATKCRVLTACVAIAKGTPVREATDGMTLAEVQAVANRFAQEASS